MTTPGSALPADPSAGGRTEPKPLVGVWTAKGGGAEEGVTLALSANGDLRLRLSCGFLLGSWRGRHGGPAGHRGERRQRLPGGGPGRAALAGRHRRIPDRGNPVLLDARGVPAVRLLPAAADLPKTGVGTAAGPAERSQLGPAAPLPAGLAPATRDALAGRWVPAGDTKRRPEPAFLQLLSSGEWLGSDGCNGRGGRWTIGQAGAILATSGISTLMACDNAPIAGWLGDARRAGLDGAQLVLLDESGKELGRLTRER
jgi:heat shock protein HslJ